MQNVEWQTTRAKISLKDILSFLKRNALLIVTAVVAGVGLSVAYVAQVPKSYEAKWQMQMAQFVNSNGNGNGNGNSISYGNSEEPAALIQRLRVSLVYPVAVRLSCGMSQDGDLEDYLGGALDVKVSKNIATAVEMKFHAPSVAQARQCAEAIVAMIVEQQRGLIEERMAGRPEELTQYQQALREEQQQLGEIKQSELSNISYLSKLDKLSWLRTRIDALQEEVMLSKKHPAKLVAPIFVSSKPVSPKVSLILIFGVSLGLMLGVLYALGREGWRREA